MLQQGHIHLWQSGEVGGGCVFVNGCWLTFMPDRQEINGQISHTVHVFGKVEEARSVMRVFCGRGGGGWDTRSFKGAYSLMGQVGVRSFLVY